MSAKLRPKPKSGSVGRKTSKVTTTPAFKEKTATRPSHRNVVDRLPGEVLLVLFRYLDASDLLVVARVCQRWLQLSNDNVLWRRMAEHYLSKAARKNIGEPLEAPTQYWKRQCIQMSVEERNKRAFLKLDATDPYTHLPANIKSNLEMLGVVYTIAFLDRSGHHHYIKQNGSFYHRMSVTARWYNFGALPPPGKLQTLKFLALNPVFYDQNKVACKNSPCQRSLLYQVHFDWNKLTSQAPIGSDSAVNIFRLQEGIAVAAWKDGEGIAFIAANFHYNNLIERCLQGTFKAAHTSNPASRSRHSLNDFNATVELRNQRQSIWSQQFRYLHMLPSSGGGRSLAAIRADVVSEHSPLDRPIELPWKTDLFKNKTPNICILDMCLRNAHGQLVLFISEFVHSELNDSAKVSYDYEGQGHIIRFSNDKATVVIVIDKDSSCDKQVISSLTVTFH